MRLRLPALGAAAVLLSATPLLAQFPPLPPLPPLPGLHVRIAPMAPAVPGHVWCDGGWDYRTSGYACADGRWILPPLRHARWSTPRYVPIYRGWHDRSGHWSHDRAGYGERHGRDRHSSWDRR